MTNIRATDPIAYSYARGLSLLRPPLADDFPGRDTHSPLQRSPSMHPSHSGPHSSLAAYAP